MDQLVSYIEDVNDRLESYAQRSVERRATAEQQANRLSTSLGGFDQNKDFITLLRTAAQRYADVAATLRRVKGQLGYYAERL